MKRVLRSPSKASLNYCLLYNQCFYLGVNEILLQSVTSPNMQWHWGKELTHWVEVTALCMKFLCADMQFFLVSTGDGNASH